MSATAPEGTQSHFCRSSGATFAHCHLLRREEQVQFQDTVLHLDDGTGPRAPWLPHPTPAARSTALGSVAAESSPGWNCSERSYQLWYERIAAHGADCSRKGSNYLTGFKWSVQRQGACRQLFALFSVLLIHEITCPVEALWILGFKRAAWDTERFIQCTTQIGAVSNITCVQRERQRKKSVWLLLSSLKCKQYTLLWQISIRRWITTPNLCFHLSVCIIFR